MLPINLLAVLVAAVVAFVLGFLFHGPLFGKLWMRLANITPTGNEKFGDMIPQMLWNLLSNFVTAYVLAVIYLYASSSPFLGGAGVKTGIIVALWVWIGFLVTSSSVEVIWMGRRAKLWLYESACSLVVMVAMGAIIASGSTKTPEISGKLNIDVVCTSALAYMSFSSGEEAERFVADCKEGKYPEVIEQYKASMNLGDGAAI